MTQEKDGLRHLLTGISTRRDPNMDDLWVVRSRGSITDSVELYGGRIIVDLGRGGRLMGVQVIDASKGMSPEELAGGPRRSPLEAREGLVNLARDLNLSPLL